MIRVAKRWITWTKSQGNGSLGNLGSELFGGRKNPPSNYKLLELPHKKDPGNEGPSQVFYRKWPGAVSDLGANYFMRQTDSPHFQRYYHMKTAQKDWVLLGSTSPHQLCTKTLENQVAAEHGFATQLVLTGRGVRAYFEPEFPFLMARVGVGSRVIDLTSYVQRDAQVKVHVNTKGDLLVVEGPTKKQVADLVMALFYKLKANPYTQKGAHIAFHPVPKKIPKKR